MLETGVNRGKLKVGLQLKVFHLLSHILRQSTASYKVPELRSS
jgi:hypothetical protein